jgi:hypothetical protein
MKAVTRKTLRNPNASKCTASALTQRPGKK